MHANALMWDCILPSGYFLLEPWDLKAFTNSPHLGVTVTVRDPNHEVLHSQERFIIMPGSQKHVLAAGFHIQTKPKQGWNAFNTVLLKIRTARCDWWELLRLTAYAFSSITVVLHYFLTYYEMRWDILLSYLSFSDTNTSLLPSLHLTNKKRTKQQKPCLNFVDP